MDPDHPGGGVDDPNDPNYSPSVDDPSGGFGDANLPDDPTGGIVIPSEPPAPEDPSGGFGDARYVGGQSVQSELRQSAQDHIADTPPDRSLRSGGAEIIDKEVNPLRR